MTASQKFTQGLRTFATNMTFGVFQITHNSFALLGLAVMFVIIALTARPELREIGEVKLFSWLQTRQVAVNGMEAEIDGIDHKTAASLPDLSKQQAAVASWLSKKYRIAPEPLSSLVAEAYDIGIRAKLEPTLILAVIAVESGFNPFAQSPMGAQGLMQVMTQVHREKYEGFGGKLAAFDPLVNLRVGVEVLQDCIKRAGSMEGGLRYYVGASNIEDDGGYTGKVMAEQMRLQMVAQGRKVPLAAPSSQAMQSPVEPHHNEEKVALLVNS